MGRIVATQSLDVRDGVKRVVLTLWRLLSVYPNKHRQHRRASGRSLDLPLNLQTPLFGPGGVLMRPNDGRIDDQIFEVRIIGHRLEYPPPNTLDAPSTEAPEHAVPIPKRLRKITPGGARTHDPQHTPSTNIRLSRPVEPFWSARPIISGAIRSHAVSLKTKRSFTPKTASRKAALNLICSQKGNP